MLECKLKYGGVESFLKRISITKGNSGYMLELKVIQRRTCM